METASELRALEDEVLRKIGRNLLLLQQVERMFKTLLIHSRVSGASPDAIELHRAKRKEMIERHTLGELVGKFTSDVLVAGDLVVHDCETAFPDGHLTFKYAVQADQDDVSQRIDSLKLIVDERNDLVHHFLAKWDHGSLESTQAENEDLDQQYSRVVAEAQVLQAHLEGLQRAAGLLQNVMSSPEFEKQMELLWLQDSRIIFLLVKLSCDAVNTDGWVRLDAAGQKLWQAAREDMSSLQSMYGYNKLRPLIVASKLFEVREELISNGGRQVLFRFKDDVRSHGNSP